MMVLWEGAHHREYVSYHEWCSPPPGSPMCSEHFFSISKLNIVTVKLEFRKILY